jgi:UDP-galactopyranose mutase
MRAQYQELAAREENVLFAGRLAEYKYYDMAPTIARAMSLWQAERVLGN